MRAIAILLLLLGAWPGLAQEHESVAKGFAADQVYSFNGIDQVNQFNGGLNLGIPIGPSFHANGAFSWGLTLHYSGNNWKTFTDETYRVNGDGSRTFFTVATEAPIGYDGIYGTWNVGLGWNLTMGRLISPGYDPCYCWVYESPDGARHDFFGTLHETNSGETADNSGSDDNEAVVQYTSDNSYIRMTIVYRSDPYFGEVPAFRDLESPDGTVYRFPAAGGELVEMRDPFGNRVTRTETSENGNRVVVFDGIRAVLVRYVTLLQPINVTEPESYTVVKTVEIPSANPGGSPSVYTFHYGIDANRAPSYTSTVDGSATISRKLPDTMPQNCGELINPTVYVPILTSITQPDGTSYEMHYDIGDGGSSYSMFGLPTTPEKNVCIESDGMTVRYKAKPGYSGNLISMRLPTLGTIEWDYQGFASPPEDAHSYQRTPDEIQKPHNLAVSSAAVSVRRERSTSGSVLSKQTYHRRFYRTEGGTQNAYALLATLKKWTDFDLATGADGRVLSRDVNYFSVGVDSGGVAHTGEYSLPFTRYAFGAGSSQLDPEAADSAALVYKEADAVVTVPNPDPSSPAGQPRFLSHKLYDEAGNLVKYTYVAYEADDPQMIGGALSDRRQVAQHDVWTNGAGTTDRVTVYSDFDGLGHYRTTTESATGGGYALFPAQRTSTTNYNRADLLVNPAGFDSGTYVPAPYGNNSAFHMPSDGRQSTRQPWILQIFPTQSTTENGATANTYTCFDSATGFLSRKRVLKGGVPANDDLVTELRADLTGNVDRERYFGAAANNLSTNALCTMPLPTASYEIDHIYEKGVLAKTWYIDPLTNAAASFWSLDQTMGPTGAAISSVDTTGLTTGFHYDSMGRLDNVTPPGNEVPMVYGYTPATALTLATVTVQRVVTPANIARASFEFDGLGRLVFERERRADGTSSMRETQYDALGRKANVSETGTTASHWTTTAFDVLGRPRSVVQPDGKITNFVYQANAAMTRSFSIATNPTLGETVQSTTEFYDGFGRLRRVRERSGPFGADTDTDYGYDVDNHLSSVSTASQTRTFTYDHRGFLLSESSPETSVPTTYGAYDARGHVGSMQNGVASLGYDYDFSERLRKVRDASTQQVIKSFDFATTNQPLDCSTCAGYSNGKLLTATRKQVDAALGGEITVTERYRYLNAAGRLSDRSTSVTVPSTSTSFFKGINFSTFRGYDSRGQVQQIHYPKCADGEPCATATAVTRPSDDIFYDYPNGWMAFVGGNGRSYASMTYQPNGLIATISHANGVDETWIGDASGMSRPCGIFATGHGTQLNPNAAKPCGVEIANPAGGTGGVWWSTGQYTYDGAGNIRQMGPARYTYDPVSRLVRESNSGGSSGISWSYSSDYKYDVYGNRIEQSLTQQSANTAAGGGDGAVTRSRTAIAVDAATNRLASASYDAAGNMLTSTDAAAPASYAWDSVGTMRSLTEPQRELHFVYTADDERIAVATVASATPGSTNSTTWTLRGFDNKVLRTLVDDSSSGGHQWSWKSDEIWRGSSLLADVTPAGTGHFILDHLGSPRLVTDESATANPQTNDFTAFGTGGTTGSGPMQFTGHERDWGTDWSRSLDYMHARYYSSSMGRFLSVDPAYGQVRSPQSWNAYTYVENNPMNSVDPTGMWSFSWIRDIFRVDDEITVHAFTTPEHSYEQDLTEWNALNRQLDRVGNAVRHETQNLSYLRPGDLYDEEVARHGAQAFIDGVIPDLPGCGEACDPFASHGYYDVNDLGMRSAQVIGSVTRDVEIAIALRAGVQKGGWLNSNRYLRIGFSRKGGMRVFRVGGKIVEFFNEKGKWDIWTGGKL